MGEIHGVRSGERGLELRVLSGQAALPAPPHAHQPRSSQNSILEDFHGRFFMEAQLLKLLAFDIHNKPFQPHLIYVNEIIFGKPLENLCKDGCQGNHPWDHVIRWSEFSVQG